MIAKEFVRKNMENLRGKVLLAIMENSRSYFFIPNICILERKWRSEMPSNLAAAL